MEKFDITTHPQDRFKVIELLYQSESGFDSYGWDNFIVSKEQLDLLKSNDNKYELKKIYIKKG
jgi:hypothetical protein